MGDYKRLLNIYIKKMDDGSRRYIIFDHESWIPYLYDTTRKFVLRIYMEPDEFCVINSNTIDSYASKNLYKKAFTLCIDDRFKLHLENHHNTNNIIELKTDMMYITDHALFGSYDKNVINMVRKIANIISSI